MKETNLCISDETVLISWDDIRLDNIIDRLFSPWRSNQDSPNYSLSIKQSHDGYELKTPFGTVECPDSGVLAARLEFALTIVAQKILERYLQIHASCVDVNGSGALLVGAHETGKTTLALTALASGCRALTDDISVITDDLSHVTGFPRPFKATDFTRDMCPAVIPADCPTLKAMNDLTYVFFYADTDSRYYTERTMLKKVIFPVRREGNTVIRELGETEAIRNILPQGFNFYKRNSSIVQDLLHIFRQSPPLEIAYSDNWDIISTIRDILT